MRGVFRGARQRAVHLARIPGERHRMVRRQAGCRADADDAAERRRDSDRAAEVGALRDRQHAGRNRHGRTAGGAGRAEFRIPGIAGGAEHLVDGVRAGCEFRRVGLGENDGAGGFQAAHDLGVLVGNVVLEKRRAEGGADARRHRDVLDADRQAVQRPERCAAHHRVFRRACRHARLIRRERDDGVELRVQALDVRQMRVQNLDRTDGAAADQRRQLAGGLPRQRSIRHATCPTSARRCARSTETAG